MPQLDGKKKQSGFTISENGTLQGEGLPNGLAIDMNAYNDAKLKYSGMKGAISNGEQSSAINNMYPSMTSNKLQSLASEVTRFKYDKDGTLKGFIPTIGPEGMGDLSKIGQTGQVKGDYIGFGMYDKAPGIWIDVNGVKLDESTLSGNKVGDVSFREEGGAPLAVFGNDKGYMRLATNAPIEADSIQLGNNTGTTTQQRRRRTIL